MHLPDALGEHPQRVDVGRNGELVEMLSVVGEQTNIELLSIEIESSVQHVIRGLLGARLVDTAERLTNGGPSSWQSLTSAWGATTDAFACARGCRINSEDVSGRPAWGLTYAQTDPVGVVRGDLSASGWSP